MIKLALLGRDIAHSKSQEIYEGLLGRKIEYTKYDCDSEKEIPSLELIFQKHQGLSITAPYKTHFSSQVKIVGPVHNLGIINCIREEGGEFRATNTDYLAIEEIFKQKKLNQFRKIVVLGSGNMAKITAYFCQQNNLDVEFLSRSLGSDMTNFRRNYPEEPLLVINACSRSFVFNGKLLPGDLFWDYNYSHHSNKENISRFCAYDDGVEMLRLQASKALDFWRIV